MCEVHRNHTSPSRSSASWKPAKSSESMEIISISKFLQIHWNLWKSANSIKITRKARSPWNVSKSTKFTGIRVNAWSGWKAWSESPESLNLRFCILAPTGLQSQCSMCVNLSQDEIGHKSWKSYNPYTLRNRSTSWKSMGILKFVAICEVHRNILNPRNLLNNQKPLFFQIDKLTRNPWIRQNS